MDVDDVWNQIASVTFDNFMIEHVTVNSNEISTNLEQNMKPSYST